MKISRGMEDYLKVIFKFNGNQEHIPNKLIAQVLEVSPPSVSDMLGKLHKEGLVDYVAYKGAKLTQKGNEIAVKVLRKHRLFETFLYEKLGYNLAQLEKEAEQMEHFESDFFFEKLNEFLCYPTHCPHGGIIPDRGYYIEDFRVSLFDMEEGKTVSIKRIVDNQPLIKHLNTLDITVGSVLFIQKKDLANKIILFICGNRSGYISDSLAKMIFVEPIYNP